MCGIVGIYLKTTKFEIDLGRMLSGMLNNMESRGPDSAGFAIYKNSNKDEYKYSLCINDNLIIDDFKTDINMRFKDVTFKSISDHLVVQTLSNPKSFIPYLKKNIIIF